MNLSINITLPLYCSHPARAFRHTATVAGLQVVSALIKIAGRIRNELAISQRHLKTEKKKSDSNKVAGLESKVEKLHQKVIDLEEMMNKLFERYLLLLFSVLSVDLCFQILIPFSSFSYWFIILAAYSLIVTGIPSQRYVARV